jgi:PilZ domain
MTLCQAKYKTYKTRKRELLHMLDGGAKMDVAERRKHPRIKIHNLIPYVCLDDAGRPIKHLMGTVLNLSQEGILLETTQRIEPGKIILIKPGEVILITPDEQGKVFEINGKAAYCREIGSGKFHVGISFQGKNDENIQFIKCMVRAHHYRRASAQLN